MHKLTGYATVLIVGTMLAPSVVADTRVTFERIRNAVSANDMSPDGRFVVGQLDTDGDFFADATYRLDTQDNSLELLSPGALTAVAVSDDGRVILGDIPEPNEPNGISNVSAIWRESTGVWESLGYLPNALQCPSRSDGYELSADGTVAVGLSWDGCDGRGFVWTANHEMRELEPLASGGCPASALSADGSLVGGFARGSGGRTPAIWNAATGLGETLDPNANALGEIHGISDDGTVLLGEWWLNDPGVFSTRATKWTETSGGWQREIVGNGSVVPGWSGKALDIANNGTIVGFDSLVGNRRAWIQPNGVGPLLDMRSYIESHGGSVPTEDALHVCQAISADGRLIAGHTWPMTGGWLVRITPCVGDLNNDGRVGLTDLAVLLSSFDCSGGGCAGDVDGDGDTDLSDLAQLLSLFDLPC